MVNGFACLVNHVVVSRASPHWIDGVIVGDIYLKANHEFVDVIAVWVSTVIQKCIVGSS